MGSSSMGSVLEERRSDGLLGQHGGSVSSQLGLQQGPQNHALATMFVLYMRAIWGGVNRAACTRGIE